MSADTPSPDPIEDIQVRLKPIFGVEPKHYLAVIYSLVILAALFALTILPGLTSPGTQVTVTSVPAGAAVTYGQRHFGTTPVTVFLPEGQAPLSVSKPGFQPVTKTYFSGNNLFLSLLFPRTDAVAVTLSPVSAESVGDRYRTDVGRWALAVPFTSDYQFPPLFTRFAADAKAAGWDADRIKAFLLDLRAAVADPQMYADYGRSLGLWGPKDQAPGTLEAQYKLWAPLVGGGNDRLALWLLANQPKPVRDRETAEPTDWLQARINGFQAALKLIAVPSGPVPGSLRTQAGSFHGVAGTTFLWGTTGTTFSLPTDPPFQLPVPVTTGSFWIADKEVTQAEFAAFTASNPQWAPAGRDALKAAGLADADYLAGWTDGKPAAPEAPVVSVSWYAAQAYVAWINSAGKAGGKKAALPDDFQWEAAARAPGSTLVNQGVWEWTASEWYPGDSLVWSGLPGPEKTPAYARSLKGGIQSAKGSVKPGDRAGWPAAGSTPGLGFRLIIVGAP